jgi:hypothetical protein
MLTLLLATCLQGAAPALKPGGLHGYLNASIQDPPEEYRYGVSLYSTAWPLLEKPVAGFQVGLASTWILPDNRSYKEPLVPHGTVARDSMPERGPTFWTVFQTIEGGLGFWTSNRYFAPTAKFRMNGSVDGYNHEVSTSGWDFYGKPLSGEWMGIVQLSSRLLVPPDGVTLAPDTCGQMLGYAWIALPLLRAHSSPVKTGNQSWTAFLNTANFRGPVAFYAPHIWSKLSQEYAPAVGRGLDALPGLANSGAIEIGEVPEYVSELIGNASYHRIPEMQFPSDVNGRTVLMHNMTAYSKAALWNQVEAWSNGGRAPSGRFDPRGAFLPKVRANPLSVRQSSTHAAAGVTNWVDTGTFDEHTFGLQWNKEKLSPWKAGLWKGRFPTYFRHVGDSVEAIAETSVPDSSGLKTTHFPSPDTSRSYVPSENGQGVWMRPGPRSGPHKAVLADGSVVTYYWYRCVDQPALQQAGLGPEEKARLQALIEKMHREWTPNKQYMAPPTQGRLASLDPALLVKPPKGMEVGYVPVAMRQDPAKK